MSRPAPASDVVGTAESCDLFRPWADRHILLAISGGPDSLALLAIALGAAPSLKLRLSIASVDHGLRPESAGEARGVAALGEAAGIPSAILPWAGPKPRNRLQEMARAARYALLCDHASAIGATHLATAHTLDDQAETVLFRLARGTGIDGLGGMRMERALGPVRHIRPLLWLPKSRLVATAKAAGLGVVDDPSNHDPRFARTRLRRLLPGLEAEGLDARRFALLAMRARRASDALETIAAEWLERCRVERGERLIIDFRQLSQAPQEIMLRVLERALGEPQGELPRPAFRLARLEALCTRLGIAAGAGETMTATLAGKLVQLDRNGLLSLTTAPPRRDFRP